MRERIKRYSFEHPIKFFITVLFILAIITITITMISKILSYILSGIYIMTMVALFILSNIEEKKEIKELQNMTKEDYERKWDQYVKVVDETFKIHHHDKDKMNSNWIFRFDQAIYTIATNHYLIKRKFNDFDIAACLIYALTLTDDEDENVMFAFYCAKKVIMHPKEYIRSISLGGKLELEISKSLESVSIDFPNRTITYKSIASIIKAYLSQNTDVGIVQLSDFLHVLYLKSKD